jgi:hypothetical protein
MRIHFYYQCIQCWIHLTLGLFMNIQDIQELQRVNASFWLELHQERERQSFIYWRLYANFNVYSNNGWRPVRFKVMENRYRHPIYTVLQNSGLEFHEFVLPESEIPVSPTKSLQIETVTSQKARRKRCVVCGKTSFKTPKTCANASLLDPIKKSWICNLVKPYQVHSHD